MSDVDVLAPFRKSRAARHAYLARTQALLSALDAAQDATVVALPNLEKGDERRPTSTYVIRPLSGKERATLLGECNCRLADDKAAIQVMYRVAGNGEGSTMANWDLSRSLKAQIRSTTFGGKVLLGVLLDGPDAVKDSVPSSLSKLVGVSNNGLVQNCILEPGCSVHKNSEVANSHVMKYAAVIGCGTVSCSEEAAAKSKKKFNFDMAEGSMDVEVGPEAGGGRVVNAKVERCVFLCALSFCTMYALHSHLMSCTLLIARWWTSAAISIWIPTVAPSPRSFPSPNLTSHR